MRYLGIVVLFLSTTILPTGPEAQSTAVISATERVDGTELYIRSLPDDADVTINGRYVGRTPLQLDDLIPGTIRVQISKSGYRPVERLLRIRDHSQVQLDVTLEQLIGFLSLSLQPEDAAVFIDGAQREGRLWRLPVGEYTLYVTRFGYNDYRERITIRENHVTERRIEPAPARFAVQNLSLTRSRFNPLSPGPAGSTTIRFDVTAAGSAGVDIRDAAGTTVFRREIENFTQRRQRVSWDGRDSDNRPLPSGEYSVTLQARSADGATRTRHAAGVFIDRTLTVVYRATRSSSAGALFAPDATALPRGVVQLQSLAAARLHAGGATSDQIVPAHLGLRLGLGDALELAATGDVFLSDSIDTARLQGGASIRWVYAEGSAPRVSAADHLIGAVQASVVLGPTAADRVNPDDAVANWPSVRLALPFGLRSNGFRLIVTPELVASASYPDASYPDGDSQFSQERFPLLWSYTRSALFFDQAGFSAAISAALRHKPFSAGWGVALPLYGAIEAHQLIPNSPLALTLFLTTEFHSTSQISVFAGAGLGILY